MHPRRFEKNANITLKSALLCRAVFHAIGVEAARWLQSNMVSPIGSIGGERRSEVSVSELEHPERREFGAKNQKA